jgi:hypothetical protein
MSLKKKFLIPLGEITILVYKNASILPYFQDAELVDKDATVFTSPQKWLPLHIQMMGKAS